MVGQTVDIFEDMFATCSWLSIPICTNYLNGTCPEGPSQCYYVHPTPGVVVHRNMVQACYNQYTNGHCYRRECKFYHCTPNQRCILKHQRRLSEGPIVDRLENQSATLTSDMILPPPPPDLISSISHKTCSVSEICVDKLPTIWESVVEENSRSLVQAPATQGGAGKRRISNDIPDANPIPEKRVPTNCESPQESLDSSVFSSVGPSFMPPSSELSSDLSDILNMEDVD